MAATVKVPFPNQLLVFWLDPKLTLETYGDDNDPELVELASKLPCKKYVGRVSKIITGMLPNSVRPYMIQFVASKKSPACPAVLIDEDMAFPLEPNTQSDLPFPPMPTQPPLPWTDACLPAYFECNILCRPFQSELTPTTIQTKDEIRMETLANESFRERRRQLERPAPLDDSDSDSEESSSRDIPVDVSPAVERREDDERSALSSRASSNSEAVQPYVLPLAAAAEADPLGRLWWGMQNYDTDFGERPAVQLSADLSLVPDLSASDPFDFAREHHSLLRMIAEHKARKIAQAQEQDKREFEDVAIQRPKLWERLLSRKVLPSSKRQTVPAESTSTKPESRFRQLSTRIRSRLNAVFSRRSG